MSEHTDVGHPSQTELLLRYLQRERDHLVGVDEEDMAAAARAVAEMGGGIAVAVGGEILARVALPIHGILSDAPSAEVVAACTEIEEAIELHMGCDFEGMISAAGFACLAVSIPSLKITDHGLVDVDRFELVPLRADAPVEATMSS